VTARRLSQVRRRRVPASAFDAAGHRAPNCTPTGGPAPCSGAEHPQCAGTFDAISAAIDWRFAAKWDAYLGFMFSQVNGGLAFGFLQRNNFAPTAGLRFRF
jgi:hypothetical protein